MITSLTDIEGGQDAQNHPEETVRWRDWVNLALLGTERSELPDAMGQAMADMGLASEDSSPEELILGAAGAIHLLEVGARHLYGYPEPLPPTAPEEPLHLPSQRSMRHLDAILKGDYQEALAEFVQLLATHQQTLPPESLPLVLSAALEDDSLRPYLLGATGARGPWLAQQNPAWAPLFVQPALAWDHDWAQQSLSSQAQYWRQRRIQSPEETRLALQKSWPALSPAQKAACLPALAEGLSIADEPFLEACLDDSRQEVRLPAAALLKNLPQSQLCLRLFERASACLVLSAQGSLSVQLPELLPAESRRDGIIPTGSKAPGGLPASYLVQQVAAIPPSFWEAHLGQSPDFIVAAMARTSLADELVKSLAEATLRHPDERWTEALIDNWLAGNHNKWWGSTIGRQLLAQASEPTLNRLLTRWMDQHGVVLYNDQLASHWLLSSQHPWRAPLARLFWRGFQEMTVLARTRPWDMLHYRALLERCAYRCAPDMLEEFRLSWSYSSAGYGRWDDDIQKMMQVLSFRKEMHAQFVK